ncbi:MAG TPA: glycosyltransferase family 2 protein [Patescibacteria group bacterium]|nr:glycosyltransferase family 2 protein [Patescibacteria group bacterium]
MTTSKKPEISVVILCFRSGRFAKTFHQEVEKELLKHKLNYEIILVGNYKPGNIDETPLVVKKISNSKKRTRYIAKKKLKSTHTMGWDVKSGLAVARGETIAIIDGDGQVPASSVPKIYKKLLNSNLDIVKTKRITRKDGLYRKSISAIYNIMMKLMFPGITDDINGKPKIFTRSVYKKLKPVSDDWFIDAEIMIKARRLKFRIAEVPIIFAKNKEGKSSVSFKANFEFIRNMVTWRIKEF